MMTHPKIKTLSEFKENLASAAVMLGELAECFREVEMVCIAAVPGEPVQPEYLKTLCQSVRENKEFPELKKLPRKIYRIQNAYSPEGQLVQQKTEETITFAGFRTRLLTLKGMLVTLTAKCPQLVTEYFARQESFYENYTKSSKTPAAASAPETKALVIASDVILLRSMLMGQLESYSKLVCSRAYITTQAICDILQRPKEFTLSDCVSLVVTTFVGRNLIQETNTGQITLTPNMDLRISMLAHTCYSLRSKYMKTLCQSVVVNDSKGAGPGPGEVKRPAFAPDARPITRSLSAPCLLAPGLATFNDAKKKTFVEVTAKELQALQKMRASGGSSIVLGKAT